MALTVHPRDHDLVDRHARARRVHHRRRPAAAGSHRATFSARPLHLFEIADAQQYRVAQTGGERFAGRQEFRGENRPYGALLTYALAFDDLPHPIEEKERERKEKLRQAEQKALPVTSEGVPQEIETLPKGPEGEKAQPPSDGAGRAGEAEKGPQVDITVTDESGAIIRTFKAPAVRGINRAAWNLRRDPFKEPPRERDAFRGERSGPEVLPGTYTVTVKYKDQQASRTVRVVSDPRFSIPIEARLEKQATTMRAGALQERATAAIARVTRAKNDLDAIAARIRADEEQARKAGDAPKEPDPLARQSGELKKKLETIERMLWIPPKTAGIVDDSSVALSRISRVLSSLGSSWDAPTPAQLQYLAEAEQILDRAVAEVDRFFADELPAYREAVRKREIGLLMP